MFRKACLLFVLLVLLNITLYTTAQSELDLEPITAMNVSQLRLVQTIEIKQKPINQIQISPNNDTFAISFCADASNVPAYVTEVWSIPTGTLIQRIDLNADNIIWAVDYSPDGRYLAVSGSEDTELWDMNQRRRVFSINARAYDFDGGSRFFAYVVQDDFDADQNALYVLDLQDSSLTPRQLSQPQVVAVLFSPDDAYLASSAANGSIFLWNMADLNEPIVIAPPQLGGNKVYFTPQLNFTPDNTLFYYQTGNPNEIGLWRLADQTSHTIQYEGFGGYDSFFMFDYSAYILTILNGELQTELRNITDGKTAFVLDNLGHEVFSNDQLLLTVEEDQTKIVAMTTGATLLAINNKQYGYLSRSTPALFVSFQPCAVPSTLYFWGVEH